MRLGWCSITGKIDANFEATPPDKVNSLLAETMFIVCHNSHIELAVHWLGIVCSLI